MKRQIWFQTDLGFETTKEKLIRHKGVIGDMEDCRGRLTFYLKELKDYTFQITTKGKLGISYPETANYQIGFEKVKPFLVRADGTPVQKLSVIIEDSEKTEKTGKKDEFNFWKWLRYRSKKKRLEKTICIKPKYLPYLPFLEYINEKYLHSGILKNAIEHNKEIIKKLDALENK
jgi:hypothetical protein